MTTTIEIGLLPDSTLPTDENGWRREGVFADLASDSHGDYAIGTAYTAVYVNADGREVELSYYAERERELTTHERMHTFTRDADGEPVAEDYLYTLFGLTFPRDLAEAETRCLVAALADDRWMLNL